jgi:hypothetical protein
VLAVQRRLEALGYDPGPLDSQYGPLTAQAVRTFQAAAGIEIDGVVGPETRAALAHPPAKPPAPSGPGRKALAEARTWIGTREDPAGSNHTRFGVWFGADGVPWCNIFVSYCFSVGAKYTIAAGFHGPGVTSRGCAYVPSTEAWLRATGMWLGRVDPQPGDIAIYNWAGEFPAIEGNTAVGNDSDGGEVMRRERSLDDVDGFGRVHILRTTAVPGS